MLVFVIPLKSPKVSKSWEQVSKLFERCIKSVCNQTSPDFRAIVVCNEKPPIEFSHPNITYIEVDFTAPKEPTDLARRSLDKARVAMGNTDKGRKILMGLISAREFTPSHTMTVDADDCVSKHLAKLINQNPQENGWFIDRGYKYQEGSDFIYLKRKNFYRLCGSCNIIRYDLYDFPEPPEYNRGYGYYKYYIDHEKVKDFLSKKGNPLKPLPFTGAVYIGETGENIYYNKEKLSFNLINRKRLTQSICEEFSLYKIN